MEDQGTTNSFPENIETMVSFDPCSQLHLVEKGSFFFLFLHLRYNWWKDCFTLPSYQSSINHYFSLCFTLPSLNILPFIDHIFTVLSMPQLAIRYISEGWKSTLRISLRCPPAPANIRIHIPVWAFHNRRDSSLLADITSDGFNVWVLTSFIESPWPTKLCREEMSCYVVAGIRTQPIHFKHYWKKKYIQRHLACSTALKTLN